MQVGRLNSASRLRMCCTSSALVAWSPWLMLMRKASAPTSNSLRIISRLSLAGPNVARILTLRPRGATELATIILRVAGLP